MSLLRDKYLRGIIQRARPSAARRANSGIKGNHLRFQGINERSLDN